MSPLPPKIQLAKQTPGRYLCHSGGLLFIQVDTDGTIHQLNLRKMAPDGILSDDGWSDSPATQNMTVYRLEELT